MTRLRYLHIEGLIVALLLAALVVNASGIMNVFNLDAHGNVAERILR